MRITYRKLLSDHEKIGRLADAILAAAAEPSPTLIATGENGGQ